jgi:hypothetical protein
MSVKVGGTRRARDLDLKRNTYRSSTKLHLLANDNIVRPSAKSVGFHFLTFQRAKVSTGKSWLSANLIIYINSSDVIQDMRINVSEEHSDAVIWYKVRE